MKTLSGPKVTIHNAEECEVKLINGKPRYKDSLEWVPIPTYSRQHKICLDIHRQIN